MTSAAPGTGAGFLQIVELRVLSGGTAVTWPAGRARGPRLRAPARPAGRAGAAGHAGMGAARAAE